MSINFNDCATLLSAIHAQACGASALVNVDVSNFVSVGQAVLKTGYDKVTGAISEVLSKTIFAVRPYYRKFAGLNTTEAKYGNHVRKLTVIDKAAETDQRYNIVDGASVDMQKVNKPEVLQLNFYGANTYQRHITIFKDQLDTAFSGPEEFARFIEMIVQNVSDLIEKDHEECARLTLCNFIGQRILKNVHVVHLLSEFNASMGDAGYTAEDIRYPETFAAFMKFALARIRTISNLMTERSQLFHDTFDKNINRHTPLEKQRVYLYAPDMISAETTVYSNVYHDEYLKKVDFETVNFWQNINDPMSINMNVATVGSGNAQSSANVAHSGVFGVIFDEEAMGYTTVNAWSSPAPFNAAGGYTNIYHHFTDRYWNDFSENGVVLLLD